MKILLFLSLIPFLLQASQENIVTFPSKDGLPITAKTYLIKSEDRPFIILFHQAGWSFGEYNEIAPKLNTLGFNCIAINQRSGGEVNDVVNETNRMAIKQKKSTTYLDAYVDMQATLNYVLNTYSPNKLIIWGSSYSASLALKLAAENSDVVDGVLAFSPGEYFSKFGVSDTFITKSMSKLICPVFITSAKDEKIKWEQIYKEISSKDKIYFIPETKGNHGSRALWEKFKDNKSYWKAVTDFLEKYFKLE